MGTISWMRGAGPLVPFAEGFEEELRRLGHRPGAIRHHLVLMGQLDRWLTGEGLVVEDLSIALVEGFLASRRASGRRRVPTVATVARLLEYLRELQVVPLETLATPTSRDEMLVRYRHHLIVVRGLAPTTIRRYERFARRFLAGRASRTGDEIGIGNLTGTEVADWMLEAGSRLTVESAKREAADLRALLRFLYLDGILETDLGGAMPPVASWRGARLPATMSAADVDNLLAGCDRSIASGRRDRAILMLLARLGLRSGEVAALRLGDVDWRVGEIVVRGKARRRDRLPLPVDVGQALVDYLTDGRPVCGCPQLLLTIYAPPRPMHPSTITGIVYRACRRAGLARVGGHRLRHALATELLRQGADLIEIAQVLRQSDLGTTSGYAKIDRAVLRTVAQPWPGTRR
ncbi:tyrosine-type recombinase/integrase [Rhodococcus sp. ACS1]|uniref:tyrosine-type recombinase/integrase n=1 Tax=Rhodococcus sp. ACS1 TaxID=2028570 RepID=UPI0015C7C030|nr:tyrosine-type recombinase/integrase [Rhodococcus sp. ACS1]